MYSLIAAEGRPSRNTTLFYEQLELRTSYYLAGHLAASNQMTLILVKVFFIKFPIDIDAMHRWPEKHNYSL